MRWQLNASLLLYLGDLSSIPFFISATSLVFLDYQFFVDCLVSCLLIHVWKGLFEVAATTEAGQE